MKAKIDATYAQIVNNKCHWIFTGKELPEWNEEHIQTVEITGQEVKEGYDYKDGKFTAPVVVAETPDALAAKIRSMRDALIAKTDWTQLMDVPSTTGNKYEQYRQALRDITKQTEFPLNVTWPTKPE